MAGMKTTGSGIRQLREGVAVRLLPAAARDHEVRALKRPWVAEEGPLELRLARRDSVEGLLLRGLAFDAQRTVTWDEDCVEVIEPAEPDGRTVALESPVVVRERFDDVPKLHRIDYHRDGVWLASRYVVGDDREARDA